MTVENTVKQIIAVWSLQLNLFVLQKLLCARGGRRGAVSPDLPEKPQDTVSYILTLPLSQQLSVSIVFVLSFMQRL